MTRRWPGLAAPFTIGAILLLCLPTFAQADLNLSGTSNCTVADFVAYVDFHEGPGDTFIIVIKKRNVSGHPCLFDGPAYGPSLVPDRIADGAPEVELCYDCENRRLPIAQQRIEPPITVNPGEVARQTIRWKTKPPNPSVKCLQLDWMMQDA